MAKGKNALASRTQSFNVGRNAIGAVQNAGDDNRIALSASVMSATPPQVLEALAAIQAALMSNSATKALAEAAANEATAKEPDKGAVATQLGAALKIAESLPDWIDIAKRINAYVYTVGAWLGSKGTALLALVR